MSISFNAWPFLFPLIGGHLILTQQQQQEMMQSLPMLQAGVIPNTAQLEADGARSSPLNLSTNNSSGSGSPHSDTRSASTVINACSLCPMQFPTQDALALHMMYHARGAAADATYHQAAQQDNVFSRPNSAPLAGMNKTGPSPWMCGKCLYSFDTCDTLAMHMMTQHANDQDTSNLAVLQVAAAAANQQRNMMAASAAEIAQNVVQRMVHNIGNVAQQQQQQQQEQQQQEQQPVFPQPLNMDTQPPAAVGVKRHSIHSLPDDIVHEFKKRKSSQPIKKQWRCDTCEQTYTAKSEFDEHRQFCKLPPEGAAPQCALCDVSFTDMKALGVHLRNPVHQHKLKQLPMAGMDARKVCSSFKKMCSFLAIGETFFYLLDYVTAKTLIFGVHEDQWKNYD